MCCQEEVRFQYLDKMYLFVCVDLTRLFGRDSQINGDKVGMNKYRQW